jgi:hypothetical protein
MSIVKAKEVSQKLNKKANSRYSSLFHENFYPKAKGPSAKAPRANMRFYQIRNPKNTHAQKGPRTKRRETHPYRLSKTQRTDISAEKIYTESSFFAFRHIPTERIKKHSPIRIRGKRFHIAKNLGERKRKTTRVTVFPYPKHYLFPFP